MPDVLLRNLDPDLLRRLKAGAQARGRSLQAELHEILRDASARYSAETRRLPGDWLKRLAGRNFTDSAELIREARDAR